MRNIRLTVAMMVLMPVGLLMADAETAPARSAPATTSAPAVDPSSPLGVVQQFKAAERAGEAAKMLAMLEVPEEHRELVKAYVEMAAASSEMYRAADKHYGSAAADKAFHYLPPNKTSDTSATKVDGDTAAVTLEEGDSRAVSLKRVGGQWKIDAAATFRLSDAKKQIAAQTLADLTATIKATTAGINADTFATPQAALENLRAGLLAAVAKKAPTATGPATVP